MKRLAVIPAREGSKRIPLKNIKDFCGRPMITHSIDACSTSEIFDAIHVSTDSKAIADIAKNTGCNPAFARPENLAGDHTAMMEVLRYVTETFEKKGQTYDTIALVYATSPLVSPHDLKKACEVFEKGDKTKALLAVAPFPAPIEHAFRTETEENILVPDNKEALSKRTQDLKHAYFDAGMFAFYTPTYIKSQKTAGDFEAFRGYIVPSYRVTDIDWPDDWERAEMLYKAVNGQ